MNTGEFAKLCGVEKRTLFHYDDLGLLQPSRVHENGYRDYDLSQVEQMDMIKLLQASGYTLHEIRETLASPTEKKREKFFSAAELIEMKINALQAMRTYIRNKEELWRQYCEWKESKAPYIIQPLRISYEQKAIDGTDHYFCFLNDGDYDGSMINEKYQMYLCRRSKHGLSKSGNAIRFFLEAANSIQDMVGTIQSQLRQFSFFGDGEYFIHPIPHLLLQNPQQGVVRITVFPGMHGE